MPDFRPDDEASVAETVRAARIDGPLEITGGATKRGLGRPTQTAATLSLDRLSGITLYEPAELVISAKAGTPLAELESTLAAGGQRLAFDPPRLTALWEGDPARASIGAVVAANLAGPRRIHAGAARDSLIGVRLVNGRGEIVKNGGRVMKNVTGYDLVKLMAGAFGTLGVLTEVTFKVLPSPETEATLIFSGLSEADAVACLSAGLGSPWEVTGAAHLPGWAGSPAETLLRLEGFEAQMTYRAGALAAHLVAHGVPDVLRCEASAARWREVGELAPLGDVSALAVWKISTRPASGPSVAAALRRAGVSRLFLDWGGGLIWAACEPAGDAQAGPIRAALATHGGHATLMKAPDEIRAAAEVFHPLPTPVMELTRKIKDAFDPARVLNPGRMYAGV
jgi:glycolate oxidase FAD binding subunit